MKKKTKLKIKNKKLLKFIKNIKLIYKLIIFILIHPEKYIKGFHVLIKRGPKILIKEYLLLKKRKQKYIKLSKRIENFFLDKKYIFLKIIKKTGSYYYIYKHQPEKFEIIKSLHKTRKKTLNIEKIDSKLSILETNQKIDIIIPWYGDKNIFKLIPNILKNDLKHISNIIIINDCYPDKKLSKKLEKFIVEQKNKKIRYIKQKQNKGFIGTVNNGFNLINNNCIILNSDTLTSENWIKKILDVSNSDTKIATITPLSNNATIFSVPKFLMRNEDNNYIKTNDICQKIYPQKTIEVPTGHGYCMFIRKKYLDKYGIFDEKTFGKGYGEENDLCMRFAKKGLKNLAILNTYILHLESKSFGDKQRIKQIADNYPKLLKKHPKYDKLIKKFIAQNPFKDMQNLVNYFKENQNLLNKKNILIITHTNPYKIIGGVEIETSNMIQHITNKHPSKNILLYCFDQSKKQLILLIIEKGVVIKQLRFSKKINPANILEWIIRVFKIELSIIEHLMHHSLMYGEILKTNKIKNILFVHDFYYFCPKADLINNKNIFCQYEVKKEICKECLSNKIDIVKWRKENKKLFIKNLDNIVFNSEFTKEKYLELFNIKNNKKFKISYPE